MVVISLVYSHFGFHLIFLIRKCYQRSIYFHALSIYNIPHAYPMYYIASQKTEVLNSYELLCVLPLIVREGGGGSRTGNIC